MSSINKTVCVPIYGGLGNTIQSIPFIQEVSKRYRHVVAKHTGLDLPLETRHEVIGLISHFFDKVYSRKEVLPVHIKKFSPGRGKGIMSEYRAWFVDNNEPEPDSYRINGMPYDQMMKEHKVVIWPECKPNWRCKRWPHWNKLIEKFDDVAVVGTEKNNPRFDGCTDYRGKLSIMEVGGLIMNADLFIGNEGGISHYAAALGAKTFIIYGGSSPLKNMPPANATMISKGLDCQPCQFNGMKQKKKKNTIIMYGCDALTCLKELNADEVLRSISSLHRHDMRG